MLLPYKIEHLRNFATNVRSIQPLSFANVVGRSALNADGRWSQDTFCYRHEDSEYHRWRNQCLRCQRIENHIIMRERKRAKPHTTTATESEQPYKVSLLVVSLKVCVDHDDGAIVKTRGSVAVLVVVIESLCSRRRNGGIVFNGREALT